MTFFAHPRNGETKDSTVPVILIPVIPIPIIPIPIIPIPVIPIPVIPIPVIPIKKNDIANANPLFKRFITYWLLIYYIIYIYINIRDWKHEKKLIGITGIGIDSLLTFS